MPPAISTGFLELSITSGAADIRIFNTAGNAELTLPASVDLSSPSGDLAGLASGDLNLYLEGLSPNADVTINLVYKDAGGTGFCSDEVRLAIIKLDLKGYKPGTMALPGTAVTEAEEDDPVNLAAKVNDDNDDGDSPSAPKPADNDDTVINANDNDIVKLTLEHLPPTVTIGSLELNVTSGATVSEFSILPGMPN